MPLAGADRDIARFAVALALALVFPLRAAADGAFLPVPLASLDARVESDGPISLTARGLELDVDDWRHLVLPFSAQELEIDVEADVPVLLTWASRSGGPVLLYGPPWRYARLPQPGGALRLDLRQTVGWTTTAKPVLLLGGAGHVVVRALRARPVPTDPRAARRALDRALLWAPESVGHTTINTLTSSHWSASRGIWLTDVLAGSAAAIGVAVLAFHRLRRGRWRPGLALAAAALFALGGWNAHFLVRFLPIANLAVTPDPEARIRDNYYFAPEVGALAALARKTFRPDERVGVMGAEKDWFAPHTLCFNLAPRPCAIVNAGAEEHAGIQGLGPLRTEELDVIVSFRGGPLPDGFVRVAQVSPRAFVARRQ
jgi:hypothetical protein